MYTELTFQCLPWYGTLTETFAFPNGYSFGGLSFAAGHDDVNIFNFHSVLSSDDSACLILPF